MPKKLKPSVKVTPVTIRLEDDLLADIDQLMDLYPRLSKVAAYRHALKAGIPEIVSGRYNPFAKPAVPIALPLPPALSLHDPWEPRFTGSAPEPAQIPPPEKKP